MQNRLRMLMAVTALLYIGPLVAGLGGFGWAVVPLFAAIFLLWLFILRPHQWPQTLSEWAQPQPLVALLTQALVQLLLVAVLFGVGRGIGGVMGTVPVFSVVLPLSISFLSIPLARMVWDPWQANQVDRFLDDAIARVQATTADTDANPGLDLARRLVAPLADLPDDTPETDVARHLIALSTQAHAADIRKALFEGVRDEVASRSQIIALILHNTDAALVADVPGDGPTMTLALVPKDTGLLALFARRLTVALDHDAEIWGKCPSVDMLADLVTKFDNTEAEAPLRYLIDATNRAQPADGLA
jgi:hypothetical protein